MNRDLDLPDELRAFIDATPVTTKEDFRELETGIAEALACPSHYAEYLKSQFVESITRLMGAARVTKSELARRIGKTRQYLGKILDQEDPKNFTITTMVDLAHHVGAKLEITVKETKGDYEWLTFDWVHTQAVWCDCVVPDRGWVALKGSKNNGRIAIEDECALSA